ncbi:MULTISPECIES: tetratricopeptide repeat protein [Labrys]|uniref:Tetratricopeptide repeat protein n=1 Tax=Labrys neptuniae TaxID=376174 RepID=A0ABV3PQD5_9HYPH
MLKSPHALLDEAVRAHKAGRLAEAQSLYRKAVALQPTNSPVLRLYGVCLQQQGQLNQAIAQFRRAIAAQPSNAEAWRNLGVALQDKGDMAGAVEAYQKAIGWQPGYGEAFRNLGNALAVQKRWNEAVVAYREALRLKPDYAEAHTNLGAALLEKDDIEGAIEAHQRAIALMPRFVPAHNNLGLALLRKGAFETAVRVLRRAVALQADYAEGHSNLGAAYDALGHKEEARHALRHACELAPANAHCLLNLGLHLQQHGIHDEALAVHGRIAALKPRSVDPYFNIAGIHAARGDHDAALVAFRGAVKAQPADANAHLALGFYLLGLGDYREGFSEYEWRRRTDGYRTFVGDRPEWRGEDIAGKTIFLYHEQGLGDALQFCRFARLLRRRGAEVRLEVHPPLRAIIAEAFPELSVFAAPEEAGFFDVYAPLMSIPHRLGLPREDIEGLPYLAARPDRVETWAGHLPEGFNIGVVWQGNPQGAIDRGRSIPLIEFAPLARVKGVNLISLQKNFGLDQLDQLPDDMVVRRMPASFDGGSDAFLDTAGLMQSLDLVVTSDTSVAHLAGALGRPVWLMLKYAPDWRWGYVGKTSPWYDSMRLFRQARPGDWSSPFAQAAESLAALTRGAS